MKILIWLFIAAIWPAAATAGCEYDTQCKGNRLCVKGECVEGPPQILAPPVAEKEPIQFLSFTGLGAYANEKIVSISNSNSSRRIRYVVERRKLGFDPKPSSIEGTVPPGLSNPLGEGMYYESNSMNRNGLSSSYKYTFKVISASWD